MLKIIMCILLILCGTFLGNWFSVRLTRRRENLFSLVEALNKIKTNIAFGGFEIRRVIADSFKSATGFEVLTDTDESCENFTQWWKNSVAKITANTALDTEDISLLLRFGETLGVTDTQGQMDNCDLYITLFSKRQKSAEKIENSNKRLYRVLGFSCGCTVTLVLL